MPYGGDRRQVRRGPRAGGADPRTAPAPRPARPRRAGHAGRFAGHGIRRPPGRLPGDRPDQGRHRRGGGRLPGQVTGCAAAGRAV
ncbi:Flagellar hook-length control protein fliK [Pseudomonas sp. OF001]|nr:Flagellar hook-length control protein fliK [Pseudomonas sp. OF001]